MASHAEAPRWVLVGRDAELSALHEVLARAADGRSETLLVFGEAGVGKTSLVQHAVGGATPSMLLLSGTCLPLQSITVPLLPLRGASRTAGYRWPRPSPLDGLEAIDKAPSLLDAWLRDVASSAPAVLLIDDLQWADETTLDVLMYLVAGPSDRRFALLATVRSESLPDGHPFHRWLADALRLPRVGQLHLHALDRAGNRSTGRVLAWYGAASGLGRRCLLAYARQPLLEHLGHRRRRADRPEAARRPACRPADRDSTDLAQLVTARPRHHQPGCGRWASRTT
jgi:AAA ATPase domain